MEIVECIIGLVVVLALLSGSGWSGSGGVGLNNRPMTPRPPAPRSQTSVKKR